MVHEVTRALPGVPVIGTGGVTTGTDAVEMLLAGAAAVGVGTINFHEPRAVNRIHDELAAWCAERDVDRVADLVGAPHDLKEEGIERAMTMIEAPPEVRDRLASPLDVGDLDAALAMARTVAPWFGIAKVGYELYGEAGPDAFARLHDLGFAVFCDLKLHDIPTTVERGAAALGAARRAAS